MTRARAGFPPLVSATTAATSLVTPRLINQSTMVARDTVEIHFGKASDGVLPSPNSERRGRGLGLDAYIWVSDLDPLHEELKERGAKIVEAPALRVYKCYEMVVEDNFGFRLCFSMDYSLKET